MSLAFVTFFILCNTFIIPPFLVVFIKWNEIKLFICLINLVMNGAIFPWKTIRNSYSNKNNSFASREFHFYSVRKVLKDYFLMEIHIKVRNLITAFYCWIHWNINLLLISCCDHNFLWSGWTRGEFFCDIDMGPTFFAR